MAKAIVRVENNKDIFLRETRVENLFINEYLPSAPGDYVRVYIFAMMVAQNNKSLNLEKFARVLGLPLKEVEEAFSYWARKNLVKLSHTDNENEMNIEFISLIDQLYARSFSSEDNNKEAKPEEPKADNSESSTDYYDDEVDENGETAAEKLVRLIDEGIKEVYQDYEKYTGRLLTRQEMENFAEAIHVYNINLDVMSYAIKYCAELERYNTSYIIKVALRWTTEGGCRNIADVKEYVDRFSRRNADMAAIFRELGFNRQPNPTDKEIIGDWMDNKGFTIEEILDACRQAAGIREPSLKYVNKVLENRMKEAGGIDVRKARADSRASSSPVYRTSGNSAAGKEEKAMVSKAVLEEYYQYLRIESEKNQDAKIDAICARYPKIRALFDEENALNNRLIELSFNPSAKRERAELKEKRITLDNKKRELLFEVGLPVDYLERRYACRRCKDTGMTDEGILCACRKQRSEEAYKWKKETKNN